jgi:hypothetical protein
MSKNLFDIADVSKAADLSTVSGDAGILTAHQKHEW